MTMSGAMTESLEGATPTFINGPSDAEEPITKTLSQTTESVGAAPIVDDVAVRRTTKVL